MADNEYFNRNHIKINYEGTVQDNIPGLVLTGLQKNSVEPLRVITEHNTLSHVGYAIYTFQEESPCPSPEKLEQILTEINFTGGAFIRKGREVQYKRWFVRGEIKGEFAA